MKQSAEMSAISWLIAVHDTLIVSTNICHSGLAWCPFMSFERKKKSIYHPPRWKAGCGNRGVPFLKCLTSPSSMPSGSMAGCRWKGGPRGGKGRGILNLSGGNMGPLCIICGGKCDMFGGERNGGRWGPGAPAGGCRGGKPGRGPGMIPGSGRAMTDATAGPSWLSICMESMFLSALLSSSQCSLPAGNS